MPPEKHKGVRRNSMSLIVMVGYGILGLIVIAASVLAMVGIAALHARFTHGATTDATAHHPAPTTRHITAPSA